jgi:AcrR family transcriptional regulator
MSPRRARAVRGHADPDPARALRQHLIAVTQRLLQSHGLSDLTIRKIARAADVSDGALYNHFKDKDELILAALSEQFANVATTFRESYPIAGADTVESNLTALARACITFHISALPLLAGLLGRPDLLRRFFDDIHAPGPIDMHGVFDAISQYIVDEQELGRATSDVHPQAVTGILIGACMTQALAVQFGQLSLAELDGAVSATVDILVRSLR